MRDFKRIVKGVVLEQVTAVDLNPSTDSGAMVNFENRIRVFLNGIAKEALTITRDSTSSLQTYISQEKIANGEMVFNTELNTFQQVINGQLVSLGSGGGGSVDPELEGRVEQLEQDVGELSTQVGTLQTTTNNLLIEVEDMQDNLAIVRSEAYDLIELTGLPENSKDLGTFSGAYLQDGMTIKEALQALETAVEVGVGSVDLSSLNAQIDQLESDLTAEEASRINGDSATLASANSYTDAAISGIVIPSTDLSTIEGDIDTLQTNVGSLQAQIDTINDTTIPTAINTAVDSAKSYTDSQIVSSSGISQSDLYGILGILYYENFESTLKGTLSNGAVLSNTPLNVLEGQKSLYFSHATNNQMFTSSAIDIPWNLSSVIIKFNAYTTISGGLGTLKAILRVYDITNGTYLLNNFTNTIDAPILYPTYGALEGYIFSLLGTEQIRIEIISNAVGTGVTIIDQLKASYI